MEAKVVEVQGIPLAVVDPKEKIQSLWSNGKFYETQRNGMLSYMFRKQYTGRFLDIGASIGNHTIYCAKRLGMEVVAIEPAKDSFEHLQKNLNLNDMVIETHNVALGMRRKRVSMLNLSEGANVGMYNVCDGEDVDMVLLDDIMKDQFDVIKIDVENYNLEVLIGGSNFFINQKHAHVFVECESELSLRETSWLLQKFGYRKSKLQFNNTPTFLWKKV